MKADVYVSHGVPIIRGTNISSSRELIGDWVYIPEAFADAMPRCVVRNGDLVFPHRGSIGEVALVPGDRERYFLSTSCMKITLDRRKADPRYVTYYFKSEPGRAEVMRFASQVGTPGIGQPLTSLRQFNVPTPPVYVQRAIADILSSFDDKIELNRRIAETLEAMARALFKSWFVDFDPVHARAEGRPTGLPKDLAVLFPDNFGENGLPIGWKLTAIANLFEVRGGNTPRTENADFWDGDHEWATPKDLSRLATPVLLRTGRQLTTLGLEQTSSGLLPPGSLLLSTRAPIGYMAFTTLPTAINQGFAGFARTNVSPVYAWTWCQANMEILTGNAAGSTFPEISKAVLRQLPILAPTQAILEAFGSIVDPLVERMVAATKEMQALAELRDTLLPELISGELQINEVEKKVSAA